VTVAVLVRVRLPSGVLVLVAVPVGVAGPGAAVTPSTSVLALLNSLLSITRLSGSTTAVLRTTPLLAVTNAVKLNSTLAPDWRAGTWQVTLPLAKTQPASAETKLSP